MEPECSLRYSQQPATGPHPEPDKSSSQPPNPPLQDTFQFYPPFHAHVFQAVSSLQAFRKKVLWFKLLLKII